MWQVYSTLLVLPQSRILSFLTFKVIDVKMTSFLGPRASAENPQGRWLSPASLYLTV